MKVYDVGTSPTHLTMVAHAVGPYRWPWGGHWRALCGQRVRRFDRPFRPGARSACPDCTRYVRGIRTPID